MVAGPSLDAAFEASPNPYMILDRELRYVAANAAYRAVTSRTREELLGKRLVDLFPHDRDNPDNDNTRRLVDSFRRVFETGQPDVLALIHYRISVDGEEVDRYWSATHTPLLDDQGRVAYVLQHTTDVTELEAHRRAGEGAGMLSRARAVEARNVALAENIAVLQRALNGAPGFICFLLGPDLVVEIANEAYHQLVGRDRPLVGRPLREALPEIDPRYFDLLAQVMRTGEPYVGRAERVMLRRDPATPPQEVVVDFVYQPITNAAGKAIGVFVLGNDITETITSRRRIETAQAELEAIFEAFPEALFAGNDAGVTRVNARARDMLGYASIEDLKRPVAQVVAEVAPRDPATGRPIPREELPFARALRGFETRREILLRRIGSGEDRYVFASGAPVVVEGVPVSAVVTQIDITERKRSENEVLKLARVLDRTHDFVGIADLSGAPTFVNPAGLALLGLPDLDAARRMTVAECFIEKERAFVRDEVLPAALAHDYWAGELTFQHVQTGAHIPVLYTVFPLRGQDGAITALATITRDLRAQKQLDAERARLLDAERSARAQAEQANQMKDQFLATVSHELRTPLTSILGWMQMLRAGLVAPEKQARALETVERNARIQAQLIDDLLDVSRILSGKLALELESVEIAAVVAAAIETVLPVAESKGVELRSTIESTAPLLGDARRLQQVVWNLLSNAVKFTPRGGVVELVVERREDRVTVTVSDSGAGIAPEFLPHVFERFRQAEGGVNRHAGGLGLGLSIVEHVVTSHRGSVRAYSDGVGRGARFVVELPASGPVVGLDGRDPLTRIEPPASLAGRRIVLVDDEEDTREYVAALLREAGVEVMVAMTAAQALALVERERPDALLSDLAMPEVDGYRLVEQLRALPEERGGRTPAVAITASARSEDRTRALRAGFQNHVAKPVDPAELFAVLVAVLPARS